MNAPKHALAILRRTIGITQKEMASLVSRSLATIQAIEYGEMPLSERLGREVSIKTGVSLEWLMKNDGSSPKAEDNTQYTKETYDRARSGDENIAGVIFNWGYSTAIIFLLPSLLRASLAAYAAKESRLFHYRLRVFLKSIAEEFKGFEELEAHWLEKLKAEKMQDFNHQAVMDFNTDRAGQLFKEYSIVNAKIMIRHYGKARKKLKPSLAKEFDKVLLAASNILSLHSSKEKRGKK